MNKTAIDPIQFAANGFVLDASRSGLFVEDLETLSDAMAAAHAEMLRLEAGAIKNADEQRQVTHFTDRQDYAESELFRSVESFFAELAAGKIRGCTDRAFDAVVINGIGGSALGPQLVQLAINGPYWNELPAAARQGYPRLYFTDNTDPQGVRDITAVVDLETTMVLSISKSGGTRETKNNMLAFEQLFATAGLAFAQHAAAVTMAGSELDCYAREHAWRQVWPMAESIGGRTSVTAIVGHVAAAAGHVDFAALLRGALTMDAWTREPTLTRNPAYLLAAVWHLLGQGRGERNMVIVPYADRLLLLSRYLQQLVMESLGKELDRQGKQVHQGLSVFGNKGGTDAHAYIQQLNDGRNDFFVTFIEIMSEGAPVLVGESLTMGDYLHDFQQGLVNALGKKGRPVVNLSLDRLDAEALGLLIALYERAVAVYAELVDINAFHQPGVQAYKLASRDIDELNVKLQSFVADHPGFSGKAAAVAAAMDSEPSADEIDSLLSRFAVNRRRCGNCSVSRQLENGRWCYQITSA